MQIRRTKMNENIPKNVCYMDTRIEMEADPKIWQKSHKLFLNAKYGRTQQSDIEQVYETQHKNGGLVRQPVLDGVGRSGFEWVFAGNAKKSQDGGEWSDTCDATADPKLSLGSNNMVLEAKLRKHKDKLNYKEVERRGGVRHRRGR